MWTGCVAQHSPLSCTEKRWLRMEVETAQIASLVYRKAGDRPQMRPGGGGGLGDPGRSWVSPLPLLAFLDDLIQVEGATVASCC